MEIMTKEFASAFLWLMGAVITDMVAVYALFRCQGFRRIIWASASIAAIFLSFFCMRHAVLVIPLAVAYALWCVFGIFGTLIMGRVFFKQKLTFGENLGVCLLAIGVVCMSLA